MKITLNWLRELVDTPLSAAEIAERLTNAGLEVESIEARGRELDGIVVAEIARVDPHPSAERLVLCEVRHGSGTNLRVVCGARNMRAGDRVALATIGSALPDGRRIEAAEIRGVRSEGMLCSAAELGIGAPSDGILILEPSAPVGAPLAEALGIADTVLELSLTPNRGDCLSVLGVARELAALTGARLSRRRTTLRERGVPTAELVSVRIDDGDLCGRYAARIATDVNVGPSPLWMQSRLTAVGLRPINNVVDVTNFVMIERGQPLHAFDLDRLPQPQIVVRRAGTSMTLATLDGVERQLEPDDLLITTGADPIAIAGVMGGADSAVVNHTRRILLESAWFNPGSIRRTSRRLGLPSESSYRFERGVDIEGVPGALDRAAGLLVRIAGGSVAPQPIDVYPRPYRPVPVQLRVQRVHDLLGVELDRQRITASLKALGAEVSSGPRGALSVVPPSHRSDLGREIDLVEEVARLIGYDQIPATLPGGAMTAGEESPLRSALRQIRPLLSAQGWCEAVPLSFTSARLNDLFPGLGPAGRRSVNVLNPPSQEHGQMRLSLLGGLLAAASHNLNQGERSIALYGAAKAYWNLGGVYEEGNRLGGLLVGSLPHEGLGVPPAATFLDLKGAVEAVLEQFGGEASWSAGAVPASLHPGMAARIRIDGSDLGYAGALHPSLAAEVEVLNPCWVFELDADTLLQYPRRRFFRELPRFPAVVRDIAIVARVDFAAGEVVRFVREWGNEWIETVRLFDQYEGAPIPPGKKSLAFSITYRAADRTLTDDEVNATHTELTDQLIRAFGVELRS